MSEPIILQNEHVFNAQSMGTNLTSAVQDLTEAFGYACHFIWTGSPVGDLITEGSNDPSVLTGSDNFCTIDSQAAGGIAGQHLLNVEFNRYKFVRVRYVRTSGTGTLDAFISAKRG